MVEWFHSRGICSRVQRVRRMFVKLVMRLCPPSLNRVGWSMSGPGALSHLSRETSHSASSKVGSFILTLHTGSVVPRIGFFAAGQLNCSSKCSAQRSNRRCAECMLNHSFSVIFSLIVPLTLGLLGPVERMSWNRARLLPDANAFSLA